MERLTVKALSGLIRLRDNKGLTVNRAIKKLSDYEDLEEKGLLLKLPCKVGDEVYIIDSGEDGSFIEKSIVEEVSTHRIWIDSMYFDYPDIGKTVFLNCDEAEDALFKREIENCYIPESNNPNSLCVGRGLPKCKDCQVCVGSFIF